MSEKVLANFSNVNTPKELMVAFSCDGRPVTVVEFSEFWKSLTEIEKVYYRSAKLS